MFVLLFYFILFYILQSFFRKGGLELVSLLHILDDFWRKMFWLSLLVEVSSNVCIAIICCPACDFITSEINLRFLIKPFPSEQKCKCPENKKCFNMK